MWENYAWHVERLMKGSWAVETSVENREAVEPVVIRLDETSERESGSDDWPFPLE
jgi:hypothetical protein